MGHRREGPVGLPSPKYVGRGRSVRRSSVAPGVISLVGRRAYDASPETPLAAIPVYRVPLATKLVGTAPVAGRSARLAWPLLHGSILLLVFGKATDLSRGEGLERAKRKWIYYEREILHNTQKEGGGPAALGGDHECFRGQSHGSVAHPSLFHMSRRQPVVSKTVICLGWVGAQGDERARHGRALAPWPCNAPLLYIPAVQPTSGPKNATAPLESRVRGPLGL